MTSKKRAALIELLRCGADKGNMMTAYHFLYGHGAPFPGPFIDEAYDLYEAVYDLYAPAPGMYEARLLEAAQRLEEQS